MLECTTFTKVLLNFKGGLYKQRITNKNEQVDNDQKKAQSEKDSHSKNRGGKKQN